MAHLVEAGEITLADVKDAEKALRASVPGRERQEADRDRAERRTARKDEPR